MGVTLAPGISASVTPPMTYEMWYLNGARTYTEPFYLLRFERPYVVAAGAAINLVLNEAMKSLAAMGPVVLGIGVLARWGADWYGKAQLDPDGGLTVRCAPHFCGGRLNGVDLTATPIPGMPADQWAEALRGLRAGVPARQGLEKADDDALEVPEGRVELGVPEGELDAAARAEVEKAAAKLPSDEIDRRIERIAGLAEQTESQRIATEVLTAAKRG